MASKEYIERLQLVIHQLHGCDSNHVETVSVGFARVNAKEGIMSKFVIALDGGTREQRNSVTVFFQAKGWKLWHWMEDLWLLAEVPDHVTSKALYEELEMQPLLAKRTCLVMKISDTGPQTHFGRAPKDGWDWMVKFWGKPG